MPKKSKEKLYENLSSIVGPEYVSVDDADLYCYSGGMFYKSITYYLPRLHCFPDAIVMPKNKEEISKILKFANENKIPVIPKGSATSLAGQLIPVKGGIVIDFKRMDKIKEIRANDRYVVMEPGVMYKKLNERIKELGYFFPPEPGSADTCTIGGMVANNASGVRSAKYGTTKDYVMALEVVLPSGEIFRLGTTAQKSSSGYDLKDLFVGSEGTLGVITEVTLRIHPLPDFSTTTLVCFKTLDAACEAAGKIIAERWIPGSLELMDGVILELMSEIIPMDLPTAEWALIIRNEGIKEAAEVEKEKILDVCNQFHPSEVLSIPPEKTDRFWWARENFGSFAMKGVSMTKPICATQSSIDLILPISKMPDFAKYFKSLSSEFGFFSLIFGHIGDGNVHTGGGFAPNDKKSVLHGKEFQDKVIKYALDLGGSVTAEHGVGLWKAPYMAMEHGNALELMRRVKKLLDPNDIMNPGKMALDFIPDLAKMETWFP